MIIWSSHHDLQNENHSPVRRFRNCELCQESKRTSVLSKQYICKRCRGFRNRLFSQINGNENYPQILDERSIKILFKLEFDALPIKKISNSFNFILLFHILTSI